MPAKLKYILMPVQNSVVFSVLEMDERFRCAGEGTPKPNFHASNGIKIKSVIMPEIDVKHVYLLGPFKADDKRVSVVNFNSESSRDAYIAQVHEALKEWAEKWEGWNEDASRNTEDEPYTFTV